MRTHTGRFRHYLLLPLVLPLVMTVSVTAQEMAPGEPSASEKIGKELRAHRIPGAAPVVDGRLDDEVWRFAEAIDDFVQIEPDNMQPAAERMRVQVAYDERYLYVAVRCFSRDPAGITAGLGRRDDPPKSDRFVVTFDPRHDHQTAYGFEVNPSSVQTDFTLFDDTSRSGDYDAVWEVRTAIDPDGWSAEFRIPFSQMRFDASAERMVWGFNVEREILRTGERDRWISTPRGVNGLVSRFGHLVFEDRLAPPRRIELLPYSLGSMETSQKDGFDADVNAGFDLRVGLGPSTLSATVNPDFGQVEADPAVLNLSVFETFFPEKRPFFLEDSRIFVLPYGQMPDFYSRRIGQRPNRIPLADNETLVSKPDQTTIIGAAKLTGKASGWTWGGLGAATSREYGVVDLEVNNPDGSSTVVRNDHRLIEPATFYSVGRVQRDISSSNVGFIGTAVVRENDLDAFTGGPDYNLRWNGNRLGVNGHWVGTHAPIDGEMKDGFGGVTNVNYDTKHFGAFYHVDHFSEHFRNSDIGFLGSRPDKNEMNYDMRLSQPDPRTIFREYGGGLGIGRAWNNDGLVFGNYRSLYGYVTFANYWSTNGGFTHSLERYDDRDTRGGPPILVPAGDGFYFNINTDSRKSWSVHFGGRGSSDDFGGLEHGFGTTLRMQPSPRFQFSVGGDYTDGADVAQWIKNEDLNGDGVDEHIYGHLEKHVLNFTGRATYSFSRDMTLQAFLQPFVAVGDYTDIRKLARPLSFEFEPVEIEDNPDFNNKSLRGTIVFRWEYLRGSTLFLVWNIATKDDARPGVFSPWRDLADTFSAPGTNAFVAKLTYWFTP